jgi:hypothetical protein
MTRLKLPPKSPHRLVSTGVRVKERHDGNEWFVTARDHRGLTCAGYGLADGWKIVLYFIDFDRFHSGSLPESFGPFYAIRSHLESQKKFPMREGQGFALL